MIRTHLPSYTVHDKFCARLFPVYATEESYHASVALERCQQQMNQQTWFTWVVRSLSINFDSIHTVFVLYLSMLWFVFSPREGKGRKEQEKGTDWIGIFFHQSNCEVSSPCRSMISSDISHSSSSPNNVNCLPAVGNFTQVWLILCTVLHGILVDSIALESLSVEKTQLFSLLSRCENDEACLCWRSLSFFEILWNYSTVKEVQVW